MLGLAWLSYGIGVAAGVVLLSFFDLPLVIPAIVLVFIVVDLISVPPPAAELAG